MARTAESFADALYITSDNPRSERPEAILKEIEAGLSEAARARAFVHPDRRTAIQHAIADAGERDVVLIAGKGHENYQVVQGVKHHFDDVEEATAAIGGNPLVA
jgi:UDP-N-acetylmuramoyl-L-alanyl-D-glutamate--2,6-diaminopimelate ligase